MERRLQRLEQMEVDAVLAGRIADYGVALEDAAKRITDLEMEGAASERRLMEQVSELTTRLMHVEAKFSGLMLTQLLDAGQNAAKAQKDRAAELQTELDKLKTVTERTQIAHDITQAQLRAAEREVAKIRTLETDIGEIRHDVDLHVIQTAFLEHGRRRDRDEGVDGGEVAVGSRDEELEEELGHPALAFLTDRELGRARCTSWHVRLATAWVFERAPDVEDDWPAADERPRKEVRFDLTADDSSSASGESAPDAQSCEVAEDLGPMGYPFTFR